MNAFDTSFDDKLLAPSSPRPSVDRRFEKTLIVSAVLSSVGSDVETTSSDFQNPTLNLKYLVPSGLPEMSIGSDWTTATTEIPRPGLFWEGEVWECEQRSVVVALLRLSGFGNFANRLNYLIRLEDDLDQDVAPMSLSSLKGFALFLKNERKLEEPREITLSPDGCVLAEWHYGPDKHLAIKFIDEESAQYASIAPTRSGSRKTKNLNGMVPWTDVLKSLSSIGVTRWKNG